MFTEPPFMVVSNPSARRASAFRVEGLFGKYNHTINLHLGERVTLVHGPNGVGKSTMLRMLAAAMSGHLVGNPQLNHFRRVELELEDGTLSAWTKTPEGMMRPALLRGEPWVDDDNKYLFCEGLSWVLFDMDDEVRARCASMLGLLGELLLNKTIAVRKRGLIVVDCDGTELPLSVLSAGEMKLVRLMAALFLQTAPGSLVLLDEIETSMHLVWQQRMVPELLKIAKALDLDFIVTTNSPDIIGCHVALELGLSGLMPRE